MAAANNVSVPEHLLAEIQSAAQAEGRSVDEVFADAVKRYLDDRSWTDLLQYGQERAEAMGINESDIRRVISESRAERRERRQPSL
jgi:metal-responsive CopG/Arc/MetJ family transcriptional regulator